MFCEWLGGRAQKNFGFPIYSEVNTTRCLRSAIHPKVGIAAELQAILLSKCGKVKCKRGRGEKEKNHANSNNRNPNQKGPFNSITLLATSQLSMVLPYLIC